MTFPDSYFHEEYRLDFHISEMMKHAWAAKLELLEVITDICKKNQIKYFACGGTLLGAIRHQGFIPWDDDIDIGLKRPDYNKLVKILPQELPHGFALAGMYADNPANFIPCDQSVVVTDASQWNLADFYNCFHGFPYRQIGIDIFPYDYVPKDRELSDLQTFLIQKIMVLVRDWNNIKSQSELENRISEIEQLCNVSFTRENARSLRTQLLRLSDALCALYTEDECDEIVNYPSWISGAENLQQIEWYSHIIDVPFETGTIAVPRNYHEVLTAYFGDYMTPKQLPSLHNYPFYASQEKSFQKYLEEKGYTGTVIDFCKEYLDPK